MKYRVLISGYYGFNNIGDESILLALTNSLRKYFGEDLDITVLSSNPENTREKFGVRAVNRKSFFAVQKAIHNTDLLISGGGSLLQDATSSRSIIYYLAIMEMALLARKKVFVYSQGIGPIQMKKNRKRVANVLSRVHGIVVRDEQSKDLLVSIGLPPERIEVACDPVIGMNPVSLEIGKKILEESGFRNTEEKPVIGFAIRERKMDSQFAKELEDSIRELVKGGKKVVLIPFFYAEDEQVMEELARRVGEQSVTCIRKKCLTEEMLSLIGNMDILVGVRLHSLIDAAIMGVPSIGISYDPKINSFLNSIGQKAFASVYDFRAADFLTEVETVRENAKEINQSVQQHLETLRMSLSKNEEIIASIRKEKTV